MNKYTTRGGVYLDLTKSPYCYKCGDIVFKFTSAKKKEVFKKQLFVKNQEFKRFLYRNGMLHSADKQTIKSFYFAYIKALYNKGNR